MTSFKVCSSTMRRPSPVWKAMLFGPWKEAKQSTAAPGWSSSPKTRPRHLQLLPVDITLLTDKYCMEHAVKPWIHEWRKDATLNCNTATKTSTTTSTTATGNTGPSNANIDNTLTDSTLTSDNSSPGNITATANTTVIGSSTVLGTTSPVTIPGAHYGCMREDSVYFLVIMGEDFKLPRERREQWGLI
ncbi:hypothetical protein VTJ49DRAFT_1273 [Mycothermus thermophilus]|uniref:Uncharacterized protein n=1 Tax=Humicola insolens TaxID=85995 RepID=A0ABR3VCT2_HUMIN